MHEKACLLEIAMQTQSIRNPTGWLHAALKNGYTFSVGTPQQEEKAVQTPSSSLYVPPSTDPVQEKQEEERPVKRNLHEYLSRQAGSGEESVFVQEFRRRHGIEGRASP